jgi:hypothetical protein
MWIDRFGVRELVRALEAAHAAAGPATSEGE